MTKINFRGNETSRIWVVVDEPYGTDFNKGYLYSSPLGWHFDNICKEAGLAYWEMFITCLKPDPDLQYDDDSAVQDFISYLDRHRPPFLLILGDKATGLLLPQTRSFKKPFKPRVESFAGSLLTSPHVNYDHYCICSHAPDHIMADWRYRDIQIFLDFGRLRDEFAYWKTNNQLRPLPASEYSIDILPPFEKLMELLNEYAELPAVCNDIETIRPKRGKNYQGQFKGNPGFPYLNGFAKNGKEAFSYSLWNYSEGELVEIWRATDRIYSQCPIIIGQNYFNFDSHYQHALGFSIGERLHCIRDTMIRQHILWPELEKSLQFLTKQYSRQPYYKDEGKGFVPRNRKALEKYAYYNGLDCCVTFQVYDGQEAEFNDRKHLA